MKQNSLHIIGSPDMMGMNPDDVRSMIDFIVSNPEAKCPVCGAPLILLKSNWALMEHFHHAPIQMDCSKCEWFLLVVESGARLTEKPGVPKP